MTADLLAVLREAFEAGYSQGHDATVEGRYADPSDAAQDYVRTLLAPAVDERAASSEPEMCPNCVTPWKCNGPHEFPQAASSEAAVAFDAERFERAPCYLCGYNGRGYYQPETHPCAAKYHAHPTPASAVAGVTEAAIARLSEARYQALLWAVLQCNEIGTCHGEPFNRNYAVQDNILCMAARKLGIMDWRDMRNDLDASALPAPTTADAGVTEATLLVRFWRNRYISELTLRIRNRGVNLEVAIAEAEHVANEAERALEAALARAGGK